MLTGAKIEEADAVISLFQSLLDFFDPFITALENEGEDNLKSEMVKQRLLAEEMKNSKQIEEICDTKGAAFWVKNSENNTKLTVEPIGTKDQLADIFTKALDLCRFHTLQKTLGIPD